MCANMCVWYNAACSLTWMVLTEAVSGLLISIFHRNEATNISHFKTSSMSNTRPPSARMAAETARGSGSLTVVSYAAIVRGGDEVM